MKTKTFKDLKVGDNLYKTSKEGEITIHKIQKKHYTLDRRFLIFDFYGGSWMIFKDSFKDNKFDYFATSLDIAKKMAIDNVQGLISLEKEKIKKLEKEIVQRKSKLANLLIKKINLQ